MTRMSRLAFEKLSVAADGVRSHSSRQSHIQSRINSLSALAMTVLFLGGTAVPVLAQTKLTPIDQLTQSAQLDTALTTDLEADIAGDIEQIVAQMIATETQHWSAAEKSALQTMDTLGLKDNELKEISTLSAIELRTKMKTDKKLAQLNAAGISSEEALKLAPTLLLSRYLLNIGRAALWGGVVAAIRSADFDYRALSRALTSGDTRQFMSLLGEGLTEQASFLNLMSTAATFACGSATLDFTPGLCDRFASGVQKIFTRIERNGNRSQASSESRRSESSQSESRGLRARFFRRTRAIAPNQPKFLKD